MSNEPKQLVIKGSGTVFSYQVLHGDGYEVAEAVAGNEIELVHVMGELDLEVRADLKSFRGLPKLQLQLLRQPIKAAGWVFSVPYEWQGDAPEERPSPDLPLSFTLHLRFSRRLLRKQGLALVAETVGELQKRIDDAPGLAGEIHAGIGWADIVVPGRFGCLVTDFAEFLLDVQGLSLDGLPGEPTFQKALTILGFPHLENEHERPNLPEDVKPLILTRVAPGYHQQAVRWLRERTPQQLGWKDPRTPWVLDGNWDQLAMPGGIRNNRLRLFEEPERLYAAGIERVRTHLLVVDGEKISRIAESGAEAGSELIDRTHRHCNCSDHSFEEARRDLEESSAVSKPLRATCLQTLSLMEASLRDESSCCDVALPAQVCAANLRYLLGEMNRLRGRINAAPNAGTAPQLLTALDEHQSYVERWTGLCQEVLSERVAGSFGDMFQQHGRVTSQRGGLQKFLHLADHLLNEFLAHVRSGLPQVPEGRHLASLYQPIPTLRSERLLGIIKIPTRHRFALPLVVPQLWHEAAQFLFHRWYSPPLNRDLEEGFREVRAAARKQTDQTRPLNFDVLFLDLADQWSDLLVYQFGFGDRQLFASYLTEVIHETARVQKFDGLTWQRQQVTLSKRLFYVELFAEVVEAVNSLPEQPSTRGGISSAVQQKILSICDRDVENMILLVHDRIRSALGQRRYEETSFPWLREAARGLGERLMNSKSFEVLELELLRSLATEILGNSSVLPLAGSSTDEIRTHLEEMKSGRVTSVATDLPRVSVYYCELYRSHMKELLAARRGSALSPKYFKCSASLAHAAYAGTHAPS